MATKILQKDKFQKGENIIVCQYTTARQAIKEIHKDIFQ